MNEIPKWFQKLYYKESIQAIKDSLDFVFYENFKNTLILALPQKSESSRERIAGNILSRFFSEKKLDNFLAKVWQCYQDDELLKELFRYEFLKSEPIIKDFYFDNIYEKETGTVITTDEISEYILKTYKKEEKNLEWWLQSALRDLDFIYKIKDWWKVKEVKTPERAFILALYSIFFQDENSIGFSDFINNDFWKLLGIKSVDEIEMILTKANLLNIVEYDKQTIKPIKSFEEILETPITVLT